MKKLKELCSLYLVCLVNELLLHIRNTVKSNLSGVTTRLAEGLPS